MTAAPFFSARLLVTAPDGTYGGIRKRCAVSAFEDRLEIGDLKIYYPYLADLRVYDTILHVGYIASDGKQVEYFFRHDTFLSKTGANALEAMAAKVAQAREQIVKPSVWRSPSMQMPAQAGLRAEMLAPTSNGWRRVAVYSALVAFPAICPVCARPADSVGRLPLGAGGIGGGERGSWLVPCCREHEESLVSHFGVGNWRAAESRLEFNIWNRTYADEFLIINKGDDPEHVQRQSASSPLLFAIKNGKRFIVYQFAYSVIVMSFLQPSRIEVIEPGQSVVARGLKYSAISFVAGWWGIPVGPIFTIGSIIRNFRGGTDLTPTIHAILTGAAVSGGGHS